MDTSRHWVEIQLPQPSNTDDTIGFYVVGNAEEILANISPILMTSNADDYIPCNVVVIESTE
jgi:hypothetical protein